MINFTMTMRSTTKNKLTMNASSRASFGECYFLVKKG